MPRPPDRALRFASAGITAPKNKKAATVARRGFFQWRLIDQNWRAIIMFLIFEIALAGFSPFGQAFEQFMIVWQR